MMYLAETVWYSQQLLTHTRQLTHLPGTALAADRSESVLQRDNRADRPDDDTLMLGLDEHVPVCIVRERVDVRRVLIDRLQGVRRRHE